MLSRSLSYFWHSLVNARRKDFIDMGVGIEARHNRCQDQWKLHLEICKQKQREIALGFDRAASVAILGAGRLLDVDLESLAKGFKHIALYDADPSAKPYWEQARKRYAGKSKFDFLVSDITGCIDKWTVEISRTAKKLKENTDATDQLNILKTDFESLNTDLQPVDLGDFDFIISLNLLSQIPIYFHDRIYRVFKKYGLESLTEKDSFSKILNNTLAKLQIQHLSMLGAASDAVTLLICDTEYYYYERTNPLWQVEDAFYPGVRDFLQQTSFWSTDSWLWHIAPQGVERENYGEIHRVEAYIRSPKR